jgi:hypothetical protein
MLVVSMQVSGRRRLVLTPVGGVLCHGRPSWPISTVGGIIGEPLLAGEFKFGIYCGLYRIFEVFCLFFN